MDAIGVDMAMHVPDARCSISRTARASRSRSALARAYNRWLCDNILANEPRIKSMLYLPFNDPEACVQDGRRNSADRKGVIGFMVTSTHYKPRLRQRLHEDSTRAMQERDLPLGFHAAYTWARSEPAA